MTKQAHRQIKIANSGPFEMMGNEDDANDGQGILSMIIQYVKRLERYMNEYLPGFLDTKQKINRSNVMINKNFE